MDDLIIVGIATHNRRMPRRFLRQPSAIVLLIFCGISVSAQAPSAPDFPNARASSQPLADPLARISIDGKYGFIDKYGKFAIEPK